MVAVGGDTGTTVYRDRTRPIVFPELPILQFLHGEEFITDVHVVGTWEAPQDEVLQRLRDIYAPEVIAAVFPGARPRLPLSDSSIPRCTLPVYKPRPARPESPDPKLKPLDRFTMDEAAAQDAPDLPEEDAPSPDEIAAHAQDDEDPDPGLDPDKNPRPNPADLPRVIRDTHNRGSSRHAPASKTPSHLPDVNAGGSHSPTYEKGDKK